MGSLVLPGIPEQFLGTQGFQNADPLSQAMRGQIDSTATQAFQNAMIWKTIEQLNCPRQVVSIVPLAAVRQEHFEVHKFNQLIGK